MANVLNGSLRQAGVLVVADAVLNAGALAVTTFDDHDVGVGLVGQDRLEPIPVVIVNDSAPRDADAHAGQSVATRLATG